MVDNKEAKMGRRMVVEETLQVQCPSCSAEFPLADGITAETVAGYESDYQAYVAGEAEKRAEVIVSEAKERLGDEHARELRKIERELNEAKEAGKEARNQAEKASKGAYKKAKKEFEIERSSLQEELEEKDGEIQKLKELELGLRKARKELVQERKDLELSIQRRLDEEEQKIRKETAEAMHEGFRLKEAGYKKKLSDALNANEDLRLKLEQGSQQLQGEVLELEVEDFLKTAYPSDKIEPIRKGARGADILQHVRRSTGQACGKIIWETKRTKSWSGKWIDKLKDDRLESQADIAVLVTTTLPREAEGPFSLIGDVWVVDWEVLRPIAEILRVFLMQTHQLKAANRGRTEKVELLYDYLCSSGFAQRVRAVVETFSAMRTDLQKEKSALQRAWAKREKQMERVTLNMYNVVGEIQAIAQEAVPELEGIEELALPTET